VRLFEYELTLASAAGDWYTLHGIKRVDAAASWAALWDWLRQALRGHWPAPERLSLWQQLFEADVELRHHGEHVASGRLAIDWIDVMRTMQPQLGPARDSLNALLALAGYPLLLLRAAIKTRLLDFRAPDYDPKLPDTDPALIAKPPGYFELHEPRNRFEAIPTRTRGRVAPEMPQLLQVRASHGTGPEETVRIGLVRYRQPQVQWFEDGEEGTARARTIVLLNGFAQSCKPFIASELGERCLASMLYDAGWDVWLLEYRVSPLLDASARFSTLDDIAAFDIPAAVEHVARTVSLEAGRDPDRTQVFAFSHCVGSASLAMSVLGGWLRLPGAPTEGREPNRLAGVLLSQFLPFVIGSQTAQHRLQLGAFLRNVLKLEMLQFTAGRAQADLLHALLDRVFATLPWPGGERCPHEHDLRLSQPDTTTCKRMSALLSRLFNHSQLMPETHAKLDEYFGRTNLGVFLHGAKCVEYERLVNADGGNAYTSGEQLERRLHMPVMLLHGEDNVLFDVESLERSQSELGRFLAPDRLVTLRVPGHAHFDCTIGREAPERIFPQMLDFFDAAFSASPAPAAHAEPAWEAHLARTGPFAGWVRPGPHAGTSLLRVWAQLDDTLSAPPRKLLIDLRYREGGQIVRKVQTWRCRIESLRPGDSADLRPSRGERDGRATRVVFGTADLDVPAAAEDLCIRVFGLHARHVPSAEVSAGEADALLAALRAQLAQHEQRALGARPGTLSRERREVRAWTDCELRPVPASLRDPAGCSFLAGACRYPGLTGFERERADATLEALAASEAVSHSAFMLLLGDQIYADARAGLFDAASPIERLLPCYEAAFGSRGFRALASRMPLLMVPDDHEIADGWTRDHRLAGPAQIALADNAARLFHVFQRSHGPDGAPGNGYGFERGGAAFFVLDTRFHRRLQPAARLLPAGEWRRLARWLVAQQAAGDHPKFVVSGSVFAPGLAWGRAGGEPVRGTDTWQDFPRERRWLLSFIARRGIRNVVFLSSDYHCSAVAEIRWDGRPQAWAVVAPALHAPLRFANSETQELLRWETLALDGGRTAEIDLLQSWDGEGWMHCSLQPSRKPGRAGWSLELQLQLRQIDTGASVPAARTCYSLFLPAEMPQQEPPGAAELSTIHGRAAG
jgi:hypothetical protein